MKRGEVYLSPIAPTGGGGDPSRHWRCVVVELVCGLNHGEGRTTRGAVRQDGVIWCADEEHATEIREVLGEHGIGCEDVDKPEPKRADRRRLFFMSQGITK